MNLRRLTTRTATVGATAALAASALVGLSTAAAQAETASTTYTCVQPDFALTYNFELTVTHTPAKPLTWAGQAVKKGALGTMTVDVAVPADAAAVMGTVGITGARSDDFGLKLGAGKAPFKIAGDFVTGEGGTTWEATGSNEAFSAPAPGAVTATLPATFTIITAKTGDALALNCALAAEETAGTLWSATLAKQTTKTTAKSVSVKVGKAAVLPVSVSGPGGAAAGKVTVKKGSKVVGKGTLKAGKANINLGKKLKKGKHKLTIVYAGTPSFGGSQGKATVTVKK